VSRRGTVGVMRIGPSLPHRANPGAPGRAEARQAGTTVARVEPPRATEGGRFTAPRRPEAALIAQLLATRDDHPQTRARRRAEPREAARAYAAAPPRRAAAPRLDISA
jgi:hypothetical protein